MTPIPLAVLRLRPRFHLSALWWLGLLYRRPKQFRYALSALPKRWQFEAAGALLFHVIPYLLVLSVAGRGLLTWASIAPAPDAGYFSLDFFAVVQAVAFRMTVAIGVAITFGMIVGIASTIANGVAAGVAAGVILAIVNGIAGGIVNEIAGGIANGIAAGVILAFVNGIAGGIVNEIAGGSALGMDVAIAVAIALGMIVGVEIALIKEEGIVNAIVNGIVVAIVNGIVVAIASAIVNGIAYKISIQVISIQGSFVVSFVVSLAITILRAYYHPLHLWFVWPTVHGRWYPWHPVAWDDLCTLPFPGLGRLLAAYAKVKPSAAQAEIARLIDIYPSQRHQTLIARTILLARTAAANTDLGRIDRMVAGLPEGETGFLGQTPRIKEIVGKIAALQRKLDTMKSPRSRESVAGELAARIETFSHIIVGFPQPLASEFRLAATNWLTAAHRQHDEVTARLTRELSAEVFHAGGPVKRDTEAFVLRTLIVGELVDQITLATGCPGLLIGGRRRMGKSTLIRNLIGSIPENVTIVAISMQTARAHASLAHLCELIWGEISDAIGLLLPPASNDPPMVRLFDRLAAADLALAQREQKLLVAIDEFEMIDAKIGEGVFPTDLLSMLRESIQSQRRIIWAFVGSHDVVELPHATWPSYFVSLRRIEVPPFTPAETWQLLTEPLANSRLRARGETSPRFDPGFWGDGGIERIHTEAGGWPHFVQLLADTAVKLANKRQLAALDQSLLEEAADRAVSSGTVGFSELIKGECRTPAEWSYLLGFRAAETQLSPADEQIRRSLRQRLLVLEEGQRWRLRVPLMRRWLINQA